MNNIPRYKVTGDYPTREYDGWKIGDVIQLIQPQFDKEYYCYHTGYMLWNPEKFNKYPTLFRKLHWWEDKRKEDLPQYLRYGTNGKVRKVNEYYILPGSVRVNFVGGRQRTLTVDWNPCTEKDYIDQIKEMLPKNYETQGLGKLVPKEI